MMKIDFTHKVVLHNVSLWKRGHDLDSDDFTVKYTVYLDIRDFGINDTVISFNNIEGTYIEDGKEKEFKWNNTSDNNNEWDIVDYVAWTNHTLCIETIEIDFDKKSIELSSI